MRLIDVDRLCEDLLNRWSITDTRKEELIRQVMADIVTPIVVSQPTVNQWVPCNERLPDETGLYIVTDKKERVAFRWYSIKFSFAELTGTEEVIAWMNFPEPYKEGNDEIN